MLRGSKQKMAASDERPLSYSLWNPKFTENSGSPGGERERDSGIEGKKVERIKMADSSKMRKAQVLHELYPNWLRHNWINKEQKHEKKIHITEKNERHSENGGKTPKQLYACTHRARYRRSLMSCAN